MDHGGITSELILENILKLIIMLKNRKNLSFCRAAERYIQRLAGPINVSVDLKYVVLCL